MTTIDRRFMAGLAYYMGARELGMGATHLPKCNPRLPNVMNFTVATSSRN